MNSHYVLTLCFSPFPETCHTCIFVTQNDVQDTLPAQRTLDLTSSLEVGLATNQAVGSASTSYTARSVLTIAFQFPFENNLQDNVATMARQYVRSVISSVQRVAMAISPSGSGPSVGAKLSPISPEALPLAQWICQSYRSPTISLLRSHYKFSISALFCTSFLSICTFDP